MTGRKTPQKFSQKGNGEFKAIFIYELREKVKETCNHLSKDRHFDFDRSKKSDAYRQLDEILKNRGYPEISDTTYHNFLTLKPHIDKEGNEFFSYSEKTIAIFKDLVNNYHPDFITKQLPSKVAQLSFSENRYELDDTVKKLLHNIYTRFKGRVDGIEQIEVESDGTGIMTINETLFATTDITHIMAEFRVFNKGKVEILSALNIGTLQPLFAYSYNTYDDCRNYFIVFDEMAKAGTSISYQLVVRIENFFDELIEKKTSHVDRRAPVILKYNTLIETYKFPDTPLFKNLRVMIKRHPNPNLSNLEIPAVSKDGFKYYQIEHKDLSNFNLEIVIDFQNPAMK